MRAGNLQRRKHRIVAEVPGLGRLVYVGSRDTGGASGALRGACGPDRAELVARRRRADASSSAASGCGARGRWRSGSTAVRRAWTVRPGAPWSR